MAEIEIHAQPEHARDDFAKGVSIMVGVVGILLAVVTIASHRAHTAAVIYRTEANDQWAFYEAKKIREHLVDVTAGLGSVLSVRDEAKARDLIEQWTRDRDRYTKEAAEIQREARSREDASHSEEDRALRLDLGEGLLELGLVLLSLFFLSKRKFFPVLGAVAAVAGAAIAVTGWLA
jgi:Domain of unknown function (DUF4337)